MRVAETLGQFSLFADLAPPQLEAIAQSYEENVFAEGERVLRRGLASGDFFVILDGEAVVEAGENEVRLGRGEFFGEISALTGEAPNADIVATRLLRCLVVPAPELEPFLLANPQVLLRMLRTEVRRLRAAELVNE